MRALTPICALVCALVIAPGAAADDGEPVVTITDSRIPESSGLAVSRAHPGLLYTVNDSDNAPSVYAIDRASGEVVGVTTLTGYTLSDTEALAIGRDGTLWVADIGDNSGSREDVALYALPEPGRGDSTVTPDRYPLRYPSGPQDAETVLVGPHRIFVVSKGLVSGSVYRLPTDPRTDRTNVLRRVRGAEVPGMVTGGSFAPDGSRVVLRTYGHAVAYDARNWRETWSTSLPDQRQGESLSVESDAESFLIGTEGTPSPVFRVRLPPPDPSPQRQASRGDADRTADDDSSLDAGIKLLGGLVVLLVVLIVWIVIAARRSHRRHQRDTA